MRLNHLFPYAFLVLVLASCSQKESWLTQRNEGFDGGVIQVPESQMSLPVRLPLAEIESIINKRIPQVLVPGKEIKHGLRLRVVRAGQLQLDGSEQSLLWSVPLEVIVTHPLSANALMRFSVIPDFNSALSLRDDYGMQPHTTLRNVRWVDRAVVRLFNIEADISPIVDQMIRDEADRITALIDEQLRKLDLKKVLGNTWSKLSNPIRINRKVQPVYICIDARELHLQRFAFNDDQLQIDLSIYGTLRTVFDSASNARENLPFPPLVLDKVHKTKTALYLPLELEYERVNALLAEHLFGFEFDIEDRHVRIDSASLLSVDSFLLVSASISGDIDADLEILGRPYFDPSSRILSVEGFDFRVWNTSESMLQWGDYFFHDEIIAEVLTKLRVPVGSYIDTIPQLIYSGIEKGRSGDKINVTSQLDSLAFDQFRVRYDDMAMVLFATGKVNLEVEKLKAKQP